MIDLIACYIGDGYLFGVTESEHGNGERYWNPAREEDDICRAWLEDIPQDVADRLLAYSNGNVGPNPLSDGYEAASLAAPYAGTVISCSVDWPCSTIACLLCGDSH